MNNTLIEQINERYYATHRDSEHRASNAVKEYFPKVRRNRYNLEFFSLYRDGQKIGREKLFWQLAKLLTSFKDKGVQQAYDEFGEGFKASVKDMAINTIKDKYPSSQYPCSRYEKQLIEFYNDALLDGIQWASEIFELLEEFHKDDVIKIMMEAQKNESIH